jgi:hypothetical protein
MTDQPPKTYRDVTGREVSCDFKVDSEEPAPPGSPFLERMLSSTSGPLPGITPEITVVRQRRLVTPVNDNDWRESDLLDNEILIGLHLAGCYGNGPGYPAELSRLIGYYADDAAQPFILFAPYQGKPVGHVVRGLMLDQEKNFQVSLVRAIRLLEIAGVVHGRITPATVMWDDAEEVGRVQLTDFSAAVMAGDPRRAGGEEPWAAAEQRAGTGLADARDDVWSAAQVIYYVVTGRLAKGPGVPQDPSPRAVALQAVFGPALQPAIAARARAKQLLEKLGGSDPQPPRQRPHDRLFREGLLKFDERLADKSPQRQRTQSSGTTHPPPPHPGTKPPRPPQKKGWRGLFSASLIAAAGLVAFVGRWWH